MCNHLKEAFTRRIELPEDDPDTFDKLVQFWYTGGYVDGMLQLKDEKSQSVASCLPYKRVLSELEPGQHPTWVLWNAKTADDRCHELEVYARGYPQPVPDHIYNEHERLCDSGYDTLTEMLYTAAGVYAMADKFLVPPLKLLALDRLSMGFKELEVFGPGLALNTFSTIFDELMMSQPDLMVQALCVQFVYNQHCFESKPLSGISKALRVGVAQYMFLQGSRTIDKKKILPEWIRMMRHLEDNQGN